MHGHLIFKLLRLLFVPFLLCRLWWPRCWKNKLNGLFRKWLLHDRLLLNLFRLILPWRWQWRFEMKPGSTGCSWLQLRLDQRAGLRLNERRFKLLLSRLWGDNHWWLRELYWWLPRWGYFLRHQFYFWTCPSGLGCMSLFFRLLHIIVKFCTPFQGLPIILQRILISFGAFNGQLYGLCFGQIRFFL